MKKNILAVNGHLTKAQRGLVDGEETNTRRRKSLTKAEKAEAKRLAVAAAEAEVQTAQDEQTVVEPAVDEGNGNGGNADVTILHSAAEYDGPPMTQEAFDWFVNENSIPGAFAPDKYLGAKLPLNLSRFLGRPLELNELQRLVQKDGDKRICSSTGVEFQPVVFVTPFTLKWIEQWFDPSKQTLADPDVKLPFKGQFFFRQDQKNDEDKVISVSGSVYVFNPGIDGESGHYEFARKSPMMITLNVLNKITGRFIWGVTFAEIDYTLERIKASRARNKKVRDNSVALAEQIAASMFGARKPQKGPNAKRVRNEDKRLNEAIKRVKANNGAAR